MKRNFHYGENKATRQARWMRDFEEHVLIAAPHLRGKIDWASANHLFYTGESAPVAAAKYVSNRAG